MKGALITCLVLAAIGAAPSVAEPRASRPDIEDEVMCVQCKTPLNLSTAAVADRELVERFGPAVLAMPADEGFGLAAYVVPALAGLLALAVVLFWMRSRRGPAAARRRTAAPGGVDARRLERDMAANDLG